MNDKETTFLRYRNSCVPSTKEANTIKKEDSELGCLWAKQVHKSLILFLVQIETLLCMLPESANYSSSGRVGGKVGPYIVEILQAELPLEPPPAPPRTLLLLNYL